MYKPDTPYSVRSAKSFQEGKTVRNNWTKTIFVKLFKEKGVPGTD